MNIQKVDTIEVVGTDHDGRAVNHRGLSFGQELVMEHEKDNPYDPNAVLVLTKDGRQLGHLSKGFASAYAPAIDSGNYNFTVTAARAEYDPERPILIVRITAEELGRGEDRDGEDVERRVREFLADLYADYRRENDDYLGFINSESVDTAELIRALDRVRLTQRLCALSADIFAKYGIGTDDTEEDHEDDACVPFTKEELINTVGRLSADIGRALSDIKERISETLEIEDDDDEKYYEAERALREKRKNFRALESLFSRYREILSSFTEIADMHGETAAVGGVTETRGGTASGAVGGVTETQGGGESARTEGRFSEKAFLKWLETDGGVSEQTARRHLPSIRACEKLYRDIFGEEKKLIGAASAEDIKETIEKLINRPEFNKHNKFSNYNYGVALKKFAQFAGVDIDRAAGGAKAVGGESARTAEEAAVGVTETRDGGESARTGGRFSAEAFLKWLESDGSVSERTARQYLSSIRACEKMYRDIFGVEKKLIDATSAEDIKKTIERLKNLPEFDEVNKFSNYNYSVYEVALDKFAKFAEDGGGESATAAGGNARKSGYDGGTAAVGVTEAQSPQGGGESARTGGRFSEKAFLKWLEREGVSEQTARRHLPSIRACEKLYRDIFGEEKKLIGAASAEDIKETIEKLINRPEFNKHNKFSNYNYGVALKKFAQFAGVDIDRAAGGTAAQNPQTDAASGAVGVTETQGGGESVKSEGRFSEKAFLKWLESDGGVSRQTAKQYLSNIRACEKMYREIFGEEKKIFDAPSAEDIKETIGKLIGRREYESLYSTKKNSYTAALAKFVKFAEDGGEEPVAQTSGTPALTPQTRPPEPKSVPHEPINPVTPGVAVLPVDLDEPRKYSFHKPYSFTFRGQKYFVKTWRDLYRQFLVLLYNDGKYHDIIRSLTGKSFYGRSIDFTDEDHLYELRVPLKIGDDLYAEANLSSENILNRIKKLKDMLNIGDGELLIDYVAGGDDIRERTERGGGNAAGRHSKPFTLRDTVIALLSSDDPEIRAKKLYNGGMTASAISTLIEQRFGRKVDYSELRDLLRNDSAFTELGNRFFALAPGYGGESAAAVGEMTETQGGGESSRYGGAVTSDEDGAASEPVGGVTETQGGGESAAAESGNARKSGYDGGGAVTSDEGGADSEPVGGVTETQGGGESARYGGAVTSDEDGAASEPVGEMTETQGGGESARYGGAVTSDEDGADSEPVGVTETRGGGESARTGGGEKTRTRDLSGEAFVKWLESEGVLPYASRVYLKDIQISERKYRELFGEDAKLIDAASSEDIKNAIERLLGDGSFAEHIRTKPNFSKALEYFTRFAGVGSDTAASGAAAQSPQGGGESAAAESGNARKSGYDGGGGEEISLDGGDTDLGGLDDILRKLGIGTESGLSCSEALVRICEYAIDERPFEMATIDGQGLKLRGKDMFRRRPLSENGYSKLSNGMCVVTVYSESEFKAVVSNVLKCCHIGER